VGVVDVPHLGKSNLPKGTVALCQEQAPLLVPRLGEPAETTVFIWDRGAKFGVHPTFRRPEANWEF
jgi:hypothetical protein